jgi:hypothetical protein
MYNSFVQGWTRETKLMTASKNTLGIPQKTLDVSRARYQLTRLLRRLRVAPRIYLITQSGKPAGALVNVDWLEHVRAKARGKGRFSIFGQAKAAKDWEQTLVQQRQVFTMRTPNPPIHRSR